VPVIFDHYANHRLGVQAIDTWLNRNGQRTKAGKPWGHMAVRTALCSALPADRWHGRRGFPVTSWSSGALTQRARIEGGSAAWEMTG